MTVSELHPYVLLGSAQRSSGFRRLVIAVTYSAEVCFALGRTALLLIVMMLQLCLGKPGESFRVFHLAFCI
jgi:thiol:disulfide interchange protein